MCIRDRSGVKCNYIGGQWIAAAEVVENRNPANPDDLIGLYVRGDADDVAAAVAAAKTAAPAWAAAAPQVRADVLRRAGDMLLTRNEDIGHLLAREEGKTLSLIHI